MTPQVAFMVKLWACVLAGIIGLNCGMTLSYCLLHDKVVTDPWAALLIGFSVGLFQWGGFSIVANWWCDKQVLQETCKK